jgi:hypothetical protein
MMDWEVKVTAVSIHKESTKIMCEGFCMKYPRLQFVFAFVGYCTAVVGSFLVMFRHRMSAPPSMDQAVASSLTNYTWSYTSSQNSEDPNINKFSDFRTVSFHAYLSHATILSVHIPIFQKQLQVTPRFRQLVAKLSAAKAWVPLKVNLCGIYGESGFSHITFFPPSVLFHQCPVLSVVIRLLPFLYKHSNWQCCKITHNTQRHL